jgi:hypothetical protein
LAGPPEIQVETNRHRIPDGNSLGREASGAVMSKACDLAEKDVAQRLAKDRRLAEQCDR